LFKNTPKLGITIEYDVGAVEEYNDDSFCIQCPSST